MKYIKADLLTQVVGSYDQTKTTIQGRVAQKTISGSPVLGPPLTKFIDYFTDTGGLIPVDCFCSPNGRLFTVGSVTAGNIALTLHDFDLTTGVFAYVGRINITTPNTAATTHTIRGLRAIDTGTTGWKIVIETTATVLINGGTFIVNSIDKADFVQTSFPQIPFATGNAQKAVYFTQNPAAIGVAQVETTVAGILLDSVASKIYTHNGISATHQYYVRDYTAAMTYTTASVSISTASPGVVTDTGHVFANNDPIVFASGTVPTGLAIGTTYFVRNAVAGVSYEVSATTGSASINTSGSVGTANVGRAFGTTGATWLFKTGNLPALSGVLLLNDSEKKAIPVAAPINGGLLNGNACAFLSTSTTLYLGLLSELTNGGTTWPSLTNSNLLGTTNQITAPTNVQAAWSNTLDSAIYLTNTSKFINKKVANNVIDSLYGALNNSYYEVAPPDSAQLGLALVAAVNSESGWLFIAGSTAGQRGIIAADLRSDSSQDYSYIVTKVLDTPNSQIAFTSIIAKLVSDTGSLKMQYRTSGFGSITGGWIDLPTAADLTIYATGNQIQFKILFNIQSEGRYCSPRQISEFILGHNPNDEISDHWEYSHDKSSNAVPTRGAFRLKQVYQTSVPTMYFRTYDLSNSLLINHNTVTNAANFEYSTDGGTVWLPLGTIPNTVGTMVRYTFTSPPGVDVRLGLKES